MKNLHRISIGTIPDAIVKQVKSSIYSGELKPGDKLPNERQLMVRFEVGRSSVREAMKVLVALGLVVRTREGTYVNPDSTRLVWNTLDSKTGLTKSSIQEVFESRQLFELGLVALAAERATPQSMDDIWRWAPKKVENVEEFKHLDIRFHGAIAKATENSFMSELYTHMQDVLFRTHQWFNVLEQLDHKTSTSIIERSVNEHRNIAMAIENKDPEAARKAMQQHFEGLQESMVPEVDEHIDDDYVK